MTASIAAAYLGEPSPQAFRRRAGKIYPRGIVIRGRRGEVWLREELDKTIRSMRGNADADWADEL